MAGELGVEPKHTESESVVLPLDDSPKLILKCILMKIKRQANVVFCLFNKNE